MQHARALRRSVLLALSLLSACAASDIGPLDAALSQRASAPGASGAFLTGRFAALQHDMNHAADDFLTALKTEPNNPELQQQAFLSTLLVGRAEAVRLAHGQPGNPAAQLLLGDTDARNGNWAHAEERYAALPRQGLTQVLQPLLVAWAQQGQGHTDAALSTLRPFVEGQRLRAVYALHAAMIADLGLRAAEAARLYRTAQIEFGGMNLQLARTLASWQARQGHAAEAAQTLLALTESSGELAISGPAIAADAGNRQVRKATDGIAEAYLALAAALRAQDASDFAIVLLQLALDMRPDLTAARLLMADIVDGGKRPEAALAVLKPVASNDPLIGVVRLRRAVLTERTGQTEDALRQLDQIARDYPTRPEPLAFEGDILRSKRRFTDAVEAYNTAIARVPHPGSNAWPMFYDRAIAQERAHQWPKAEADFNRALELSPEQPYVMNYLAYSWTEQGRNLPRARQMLERAVELRPNDGSILDSLGWVTLRQGDTKGAIKLLEHAVELQSEDATVNGHLGDAYWAAGRKLEAQFQWRRALNLKPDQDDVPKLEAKLHESEQALGMAATPATAQRATP